MVQFRMAIAAAALLATTAHAVTPVVVQGADFVNAVSGARFQMIGVDYQPGGSSGFNPGSGKDPLSDASICLRDAILMQRLGINTVRVYNLDPSIDHTQCMSIFNAAGMYMVLDVNSPLPNQSINRVSPWESYNSDYMKRVFGIVEAFKNFNNTLGFFSANEVINEESDPSVPAYIRAVTRDLKDYISAHSKRSIPVGYSAADVRPLLADTFNYLSCDLSNETSSKIDFFGLNSYSWCGSQATYQTSGYDVLVNQFSNTSIPIFFSEFGCNDIKPRTFTEIGSIYALPMAGVFSGGMVYEYSEEANEFGLVTINSDNSIDLKQDYMNLQGEYGNIDLKALTAANGTATGRTAPTCVSSFLNSNLTRSFAVPSRLSDIQSLISNGVGGTWPTGVVAVSSTSEAATVRQPNGQTLTGLSLRVLGNDQSNLPGNNISGTNGTSGPGTNSSSSGTSHKNAAALPKVDFGTVALAAMTFGLWTQL